MRKTLPDLFETQPDLLFQLVTMLNPSVLQENGVSVYGVFQEPGNFVITFPRSFHGGFNFDWLPHGGSGAELYPLYYKPAVISHQELLSVVAKQCLYLLKPNSMILAVDDSLIDRKLIESLLKNSSYQVTAVDSGSKALEFLGIHDEQGTSSSGSSESQEIEVNLIITDYCMPGMTGYDLRKIKESSSLKDRPVVIMSSENVPSRICRWCSCKEKDKQQPKNLGCRIRRTFSFSIPTFISDSCRS